jgi:hypothetical protein
MRRKLWRDGARRRRCPGPGWPIGWRWDTGRRRPCRPRGCFAKGVNTGIGKYSISHLSPLEHVPIRTPCQFPLAGCCRFNPAASPAANRSLPKTACPISFSHGRSNAPCLTASSQCLRQLSAAFDVLPPSLNTASVLNHAGFFARPPVLSAARVRHAVNKVSTLHSPAGRKSFTEKQRSVWNSPGPLAWRRLTAAAFGYRSEEEGDGAGRSVWNAPWRGLLKRWKVFSIEVLTASTVRAGALA